MQDGDPFFLCSFVKAGQHRDCKRLDSAAVMDILRAGFLFNEECLHLARQNFLRSVPNINGDHRTMADGITIGRRHGEKV
jgi:hypothetical protein